VEIHEAGKRHDFGRTTESETGYSIRPGLRDLPAIRLTPRSYMRPCVRRYPIAGASTGSPLNEYNQRFFRSRRIGEFRNSYLHPKQPFLETLLFE
jgi:hypothetical protein